MLIIVVLIFLEENFGDLSKNFNRLMCTFGFELLAFTPFSIMLCENYYITDNIKVRKSTKDTFLL